MSIYRAVSKGKHIQSPAIRYLYYVIPNSFQARGEFTRLNEEDKIILAKAAIYDCNVTPNLGAMLLFNLERQAHQICGDITYGGVATVLATSLGLDIGKLQPLDGERRVSFHTLRVVGIVFTKKVDS